jgi:hypothetical protein
MANKITGKRSWQVGKFANVRRCVGTFDKWIFPAIRMKLTSTPILGGARKLRARWRAEVDQNLHAFHSMDARDFVQVQPMADYYETTMRQIKVNKAKLLETIKKNRDEHRGLVKEAQKRFREIAIKALDATLKAALNGKPFELNNLVAIRVPEDHTRDYDRSIQMLEMSVEDEIIVNEQEFQNYVQDIWGWSRNWAISNSDYVNRNSRYYGKLSAMASSED